MLALVTIGLIATQATFSSASFSQSKAESLSSQTYNVAAEDRKVVNNFPVIGVLTQPLNDEQLTDPDNRYEKYSSYMRKSYVDYLEASGARVVPLIYGSGNDDAELAKIDKLQGVFYCGGTAGQQTYKDFGKRIFDKVRDLNDKGVFLPIWGTCLGFQGISSFAATNPKVLESYDSQNDLYAMKFAVDPSQTRMYRAMGNDAYLFEQNKIQFNFHKWGISPAKFQSDKGLKDFYTVTSTAFDNSQKEFVNSIEAKNYPFYGTQFHPEAPLVPNRNYQIDRSLFSTINNRYFGDFYVNQCRTSNNNMMSWEEFAQVAVENYTYITSADNSRVDVVF
ncbi:peptidase c26 family protein [Stylonychia lemnae]|uniref:folate gamma-glutamyl hydrolase n=1 Tax=Stylonychia lemnae TaxID=5949 RepID=A0A078B5Q3_STYLE|nr:peptidase c26 family protein [Stylonychia lemnae]|eukprot:CDW89850.1 peptidase c26 family protein [Stylonychia lemnae]